MPASVVMAGTPCGTALCSPVEVPHFTPHALTEEPFTPPLSQAYMSFSTSCVSSNHPPPEDFHLSFHPQSGMHASCLLPHHLHTGAGDTSLITPQSAKPPQLSLCLSQHQSTTNESLTPHTVTTHLYVPPTSTHTLTTSSLISHTPYSSSYSPWMASSAVSLHSPLMATGEHVTPPLQSLSLCKRHPQVCLASGGPLVSLPFNTTCVSHPSVRPHLVHSSPSYIPHPSLSNAASFSQITRVPLASIASHSVTTSVDADLLHALLEPHPCVTFVAQVVSGMRHGFRIGYKGPRSPLQAPNLSSAFLHPAAVDQALNKEIQAGRIAGPFNAPPFPDLRCSGLGLVPKDGDSWRLIFHLSAPAGASVNDHIPPDEFSLQYHTIDDAISILVRLGPNALMAKADIRNAFRLCPVHPCDWPLLGMRWRQQYFVDKCLPFGLRSSPFLFNLLADALQWCLSHYFGVQDSFHYLDDFFFAGPATSPACHTAISHFQSLCKQLGVPLKPEKLVLPTTHLVFLGIHLDSVTQKASMPQDKLETLMTLLQEHIEHYRFRRHVTKRSLLSLIGKLSFATKVIPAGRIFLRRLLDLAHSVPDLDTTLLLTQDVVLDINWWLLFARSWNGQAFFLDPTWSHSPEMDLYTDASSEIGFGAYWEGHWFQQTWSPINQHHSIQWKELYAILMACEVWGHLWGKKRILFHCDNQSMVHLWRNGLSQSPTLMHLVRALFFVAAHHNFHITISHIAGTDNSIADALSRFHMQRFSQLAPDADQEATTIPAQLTFHSSTA